MGKSKKGGQHLEAESILCFLEVSATEPFFEIWPLIQTILLHSNTFRLHSVTNSNNFFLEKGNIGGFNKV